MPEAKDMSRTTAIEDEKQKLVSEGCDPRIVSIFIQIIYVVFPYLVTSVGRMLPLVDANRQIFIILCLMSYFYSFIYFCVLSGLNVCEVCNLFGHFFFH